MVDLTSLIATQLPRLIAPWVPEALWRVPTADRVAYLTFDDGPSATMTYPLLRMLEAADAKATFLLVGRSVQQYPDRARAIKRAGHTIGNHTLTHPYPWRATAAEIARELALTNRIIANITGTKPPTIRPPYGQLTPTMLQFARAHGQQCLMWDVAPGDFLSWVDAERVRHHVLRFIRPGSIIVLHDNPIAREAVLPALPPLLRDLTHEGWRFEAL
ncbi:MAG: polysaccharide deacetylase family protein [Bacteroidetes bacterium]|jgi:peptidoglycan/xylan/chitin deacetylase (PgdA/CDA1 family)|nr:polysaccharide deacetylase family protein [Bacteroidota bacterium]